MDCPDDNLVAAYLEGTLPPAQEEQIRAHLDECAACRELLAAGVRSAPGGADTGPHLPAPAEFHYTLLREYARGGQARIWLGVDDVLGREVAIKELLPRAEEAPGSHSRPGESARARFLREARVAGQLQHPGSVPVYELGRTPEGKLYYSMRLIRGQTLAQALAERATLDERLSLLDRFLALCHTIAYAHSRGVIHRDIKPANVMIGRFGETVVLDWGLAKVRGQADLPPAEGAGDAAAAPAQLTMAGASIGTPAYMSPEQAGGRPEEVDELSDVFGLGAVLFELLTGRPPFLGQGGRDTLEAARNGSRPRVLEISPDAPAELAAIAEKAMSSNRAGRFPSAESLAAEIQAFLTGRRVSAYNYSAWDLLQRFALRHKIALVATLAVLLVIVAALVATTIAYREEAAAHRAESRALLREEQRWAQAEREGAAAAAARGSLLEARAKLRASLEILDSAPGRALWWRLEREPLWWSRDLGAILYDVRFSPDGRYLAVASQDRSVALLELQAMERLTLEAPAPIVTLDVSSDGGWVAGGSERGEVILWRIPNPTPERVLAGSGARLWRVRFHPGARQLASAGEDRQVRLWRFPEMEIERTLALEGPEAAGIVSALAYSPDGSRLASLHGLRATLALWDARDGSRLGLYPGHQGFGSCLSFSPDGRWLASGSADQTVRLLDVARGQFSHVLQHPAYVTELAFSPDGSLITGCFDGSLRRYDPVGGSLLSQLSAQPDSVDGLDADPRGRLLASASQDGILRIWHHLGDPLERPPQGHSEPVQAVAFSPQGERIASAGQDGLILIRDAASGLVMQRLSGHRAMVTSLDFSPGGQRLASGSWDHSVSIWDLGSGRRTLLMAPDYGPVASVAFAPGGGQVAAGYVNTPLVVWDLATRRDRRLEPGHANQVLAATFSPDGRWLASAGRDHSVRLWPLPLGAPRVLRGESPNTALAWHRDSPRFAWADEAGRVRLGDVRDGSFRILVEAGASVWALAFQPGADRLAAACADGVIRIWDLSGAEVLRIDAHRGEVTSLRYDAQGRRLVSAGTDDTVRLWDAESGAALWTSRLLMPGAPLLLTQRGWARLSNGVENPAPAPPGAWARAVEGSRRAFADPEGGCLCLVDARGVLEQWDVRADARRFSGDVGPVQALWATSRGCLTLAGDRALWTNGESSPRLLAEGAKAIFADGDGLLVAQTERVLAFAPDGSAPASLPGVRDPSAVARSEGRLVLGSARGAVSVRTLGKPQRAFELVDTPPSPVARIEPLPMGTALVAFADGRYGLWDLSSGERMHLARLHGAVTHVAREGGRLWLASELGDVTGLDLEVLDTERCRLLRRIWQDVPVVWRDGRPVVRSPPADHPCLGENGPHRRGAP
ncbi:MAG: protein kinase [Myxococcales bacterium]|nr:protein kinase [Myxococcales bacterium]